MLRAGGRSTRLRVELVCSRVLRRSRRESEEWSVRAVSENEWSMHITFFRGAKGDHKKSESALVFALLNLVQRLVRAYEQRVIADSSRCVVCAL